MAKMYPLKLSRLCDETGVRRRVIVERYFHTFFVSDSQSVFFKSSEVGRGRSGVFLYGKFLIKPLTPRSDQHEISL